MEYPSRFSARVVLGRFVVAAAITCCAGASKAQAQECKVAIVTPHAGDHVGATGDVAGTAKIPDRSFLWIMAHRSDLKRQWWPQGGGPLDLSGAEWHVSVYYGKERDIGKDFEIAAVVVGADENERLKRWVEEAPVNDYPPTSFPNPVSGCVPQRTTVVKTSHD